MNTDLRLSALKLAINSGGSDPIKRAGEYYDFLRGSPPPSPEKQLADIPGESEPKWFDIVTAPRNGRLIILAVADSSYIPDEALWDTRDGVLASWAVSDGRWFLPTDLDDLSNQTGGYSDSLFYAWRPWGGDEKIGPRDPTPISGVEAAPSHPPADPIETVGSELSLHLPEYVTIRSKLLTAAERAQLLVMMQEADKRGQQPLGEWLAANPVD